METSTWTPPDLVNWIEQDLKKRGLPAPHRLEAEYLVSHALNISRLEIYLNYDKPCSLEERAKIKQLLRRRQANEPLPYIIGNCDFWSLTLTTRPGVLIPRQDTEILVEVILKYIPDQLRTNPFKLAELGTGTAAIPLAICLERKQLEIITVEKSSLALSVAQDNIRKYHSKISANNNQIHIIQGDNFSALSNKNSFDLIISNPPYIPSADLVSLQKEITQWEPEMALNGGADGLEFYRSLFLDSKRILRSGGLLIVEHGFNQKKDILKLCGQMEGISYVDSIKDIEGRDRVIVSKKL